MPIYNCYCNKYNNACKESTFDSSKIIIPHSCGLICEKVICEHLTCDLPCHPGPHVLCNVIADLNCYCEKVTKSVSCISGIKEYSCGDICGKKLQCKIHECKQICHDDECDKLLHDGR